MSHRRFRRACLVLAWALALAGVLPAAGAGASGATAKGGTEYRYWSYWRLDGGRWTYASVGPGGARPQDGDVEGWRFVAGREGDATPPRGTSDAREICRDIPARDGHKRVAVVVDYGERVDAPAAEQPPQPRTACASVPEAATGADVVAAVAAPRFGHDGLLCALDGYPPSGCAEAVSSSPRVGAGGGGAGDTGAGGDGDLPVGLVVGVGLVGALGGAALWRARSAGRP